MHAERIGAAEQPGNLTKEITSSRRQYSAYRRERGPGRADYGSVGGGWRCPARKKRIIFRDQNVPCEESDGGSYNRYDGWNDRNGWRWRKLALGQQGCGAFMPGLARIDMEKSMQGCGIGDTQGRKEQHEQSETGALVASQFPEPLSREGDHYISNNETRHDTARKWNLCKSLAGFEMRQGAGALLDGCIS